MSHRIQYRRDTRENWLKYNPVLMEGEVGYEIDTHHQKIGDGIHKYSELEYEIGVGNITQETGDRETLVMSQKAVTQALNLMINNIYGREVLLTQDEFDELGENIDPNKIYYIYEEE